MNAPGTSCFEVGETPKAPRGSLASQGGFNISSRLMALFPWRPTLGEVHQGRLPKWAYLGNLKGALETQTSCYIGKYSRGHHASCNLVSPEVILEKQLN